MSELASGSDPEEIGSRVIAGADRSIVDGDVPDLRPSPWRVHAWILVTLAAAYLVLAWSAWPTPAPVPTGKLDQGLSVLVGIGEGAAMAAILMGGVAVLFYAAISTAVIGIARRGPWLVHLALIGAMALAATIASVR